MSPCPIAPADRRLRDAFQLWRKMERAYFEPDEFRVNLNSFIQEARNVTFILQKNKHNVPEFDTFYSPWQARLRDDPIMRWVVESRNRITKEGDLETESQNVVTFTADWTNERTRRFEASPALPSTLLINAVLKKIPRELITEESLLCVERRWVDAALPGKELLNVSSHVLIVLSTLLEAAHAQIQRVCSQCSCDVLGSLIEMRKDYPLELAQAEQSRKVWVKAENQKRIRYSIQSAKGIRRGDAGPFKAAIRARYGPAPILPADIDTKTLEGAVLFFTERAKAILSSDGHLSQFIFVLNSDGELLSVGLSHEDRAEKHIVIRQAASYLATMNVQWAIFIGEAWWVPIAEAGEKIRHAVDAPNRREAIAVTGVATDGRSCNRRVEFSRKGKEFVFGEETVDSETVNIMLPIREAISSRSRD
jgi:hypothetical protein